MLQGPDFPEKTGTSAFLGRFQYRHVSSGRRMLVRRMKATIRTGVPTIALRRSLCEQAAPPKIGRLFPAVSVLNMPRRFIRQLTEGEDVDEVYLASDKQLRTNRGGNLYLQVRLSDRTGAICGMLWNANQTAYDGISNGDYVRVRAKTQLYNGGLQLILKSIVGESPSAIDPADFQTLSPTELDGLMQQLSAALRQMRNVHLRNLADCFLSDDAFLAQLQQAPAGVKHHHAYRGGLLQHIVSLLKLSCFASQHYPTLDADLLTMGVFLHDIGKLQELSYDPDLGYTTPGQLLGHMVLALGMLDEKIAMAEKLSGEPFPESLAVHLKHLIVSHHGEYEFGSPKLPMSREAIALHLLDNLDAKLHCLDQLIVDDVNKDSEWTVYHPHLGRKIYKGEVGRGS
jgi:3'-5' exoribonuclease